MIKFLFTLLFFPICILANPSPERQQQLKHLLKHDCGACHGMTLKGGLGSPLLAKDLQHKTDEFLITTILKGRKNTAMPPWENLLTENEAIWLVNLLRNTESATTIIEKK